MPLVAPLVLETLPRGELTRRAQEIAARHYDIPSSQRSSVSVDTLLEWALHAVGDSYLLLRRPAAELPTVELRFQFRYAAPLSSRRLQLDPNTLCFSSAGPVPAATPARRKVEPTDVSQVLAGRDGPLRYNQLRQHIMNRTQCSKRTAQLAIHQACQQGVIVPDNGHYRLPLSS